MTMFFNFPFTPVPEFEAKLADKFVLRQSQAMKSCMEVMSSISRRSINSEYQVAIETYSKCRESYESFRTILKERLEALEDPSIIDKELSSLDIPEFLGECEKAKLILRLLPGQRDMVRDIAKEQTTSEVGKKDTMKSYIHECVTWWVRINTEISFMMDRICKS